MARPSYSRHLELDISPRILLMIQKLQDAMSARHVTTTATSKETMWLGLYCVAETLRLLIDTGSSLPSMSRLISNKGSGGNIPTSQTVVACRA